MPKTTRVVVLRRRMYCKSDASVHRLRRVSEARVAFDGAVFFGSVDECEAYARTIGVSVGTIAEPRKATTGGEAHEIMFDFESKLHDLDANS